VNFVYLGTTGSPKSSGNCTDSGRNPVSPEPQVIQEPTTPVPWHARAVAEGKNSIIPVGE